MRCQNCNASVEAEDVFCPSCGASLSKKRPSKILVITISLVILLAIAAAITFWLFYGHDNKESEKSLQVEEAEVKKDIEPDAEPEAYDTDCTVPGDFWIEGEIVQEGNDYYLEFAEKKDLLIKKENGKETVMKDKNKLKVQASESLIPYNGCGVRVNGTVSLDFDENLQIQTDNIMISESKGVEEGGIHRYEYIVSDCTWQQAFDDCIKRGGYLARINSKKEYDYILSEIRQKGLEKKHFRIGGRRDATSEDYYWVNDKNQFYGEKVNSGGYWCNSEWMANEPSYSDKDIQETSLDIFYYEKEERWVWNDVPDNIIEVVPEYAGKLGYICEYEN
ncbi:zinc-ribbon domain-containing protein [Bariatricus massiliensis]|uniref:Zinc-ribbon domain-containing protein n=1 Tax=Bariatricus massiliensis TaxID=1745713 RepID=A0ABS8DF74_9FIRM|nr:zinc-ribbon domain-containing protein [Bariatricus massiliensis]MCB7303941.1 zinc-ribbon domain-containing protein [Bariatricus massiliensis]MCB7374628.1 zinc-ribbon domain-containing protein [Bariatricus massiliensis]MCB7387051.1 zinc-ribbon domain-containing protein [Bariatricus massiliensis]MCB7411213.1 zinc-ribbon domain-containing protein [Bariatricus massiliensis]MCQ5252843.1 zinc-ribbon domain-containing protein [Bariatricus massiliensis]